MKKHTWKIILPIIFSIVYIVLDYVNFPSLLGVSSQSLNFEFLGIVIDATIVIVLYTISFYYIDNRQNEKDKNARNAATIMFEKTYQECLENLKFLDNKAVVSKYIIPKIDGTKTDSENKVIRNLQTLPFASFDTIISLAQSGYITECTLSNYLEIKKEYQYLVSVKITFYDLSEPQTPEQKFMFNDINNRDKKLKDRLEQQLNQQ